MKMSATVIDNVLGQHNRFNEAADIRMKHAWECNESSLSVALMNDFHQYNQLLDQ